MTLFFYIYPDLAFILTQINTRTWNCHRDISKLLSKEDV